MGNINATVNLQGSVCEERRPDDCGIVVFGASGDLVARKLIPALFGLYVRMLLPPKFYILGFARSPIDDNTFRKKLSEAILEAYGETYTDEITEFIAMCRYVSGEYTNLADYDQLSQRCSLCDRDFDATGNRLFYLALPPHLHPVVVQHLSEAGLTTEGKEAKPWARVVFEKPFGHDLASALELDSRLSAMLDPKQIFRMDHYLGKETVQSILMFRFANTIFEPLWNRQYIDHIQITVAEELGVEHRGKYYEGAGCLRDMFQNHMMQMLALVAMEPPVSFEAEKVRDERVKLLSSVRPWPVKDLDAWVVRGQYCAGKNETNSLKGYREEPDVASDSSTETFVAAKLLIDNWRWQGTPFFLRTGKRMPKKVSEIAVVFKRVPHSLFGLTSKSQMPANVLVLKIQPDEGIRLSIQTKQPGPKACISTMNMSFNYQDIFGIEPPDAYERLLLDCMQGDRTLFWSRNEVKAAWKLIDPILQEWNGHASHHPVAPYAAGSWGPEAADTLITSFGRRWRNNSETAMHLEGT